MTPLDAVLKELSWLVAADTRNPPRKIGIDAPLFSELRSHLPGFDCTTFDYGDGCLAFHAVRGKTDTLFNVHLDTVPVAPGWTSDPFKLTFESERAIGLGACDIKGAAACLIALAQRTDAPAAFLFSTDEEAGSSTAVRGFLKEGFDYERAIVCEPTRARAVIGHRGIFSAEATFTGVSGHASKGGRSAVHAAAKWIAACLDAPETQNARLNIGRVEGGLKPNMIAAECQVLFGMRPPAGSAPEPILRRMEELSADQIVSIAPRFKGPALPESADAAARQATLEEWAQKKSLATADPVDFWTEASLFAAAGIPALVLGPGDIAQAHSADEWVSYEDLTTAYDAFHRILTDA